MKQLKNFINGEFVSNDKWFEKRSPLDNSVIAQVCEAGAAEVDAAVKAARAALNGPWSRARQPGIPVAVEEIVADGIKHVDQVIASKEKDILEV